MEPTSGSRPMAKIQSIFRPVLITCTIKPAWTAMDRIEMRYNGESPECAKPVGFQSAIVARTGRFSRDRVRVGACLSIPRGRDRDGFAFSRGGADVVGYNPMRRRQRRMKANPSGPEGLALQGASAVLRGLHPLPCRANAAHAEYSDRLLTLRHANPAFHVAAV